MPTEQITISVDTEAARVYYSVSPEAKRKLEILLSLRLLEVMRSPQSLKEIMGEISQAAQRRGLTPEILQTLLEDDAE